MSTSSSTSSNPSSPRSKRRDFDDCEDEEFEYRTKIPKYANKYEEMLQPLSPVTILPSKTSRPLPLKTHLSDYDEKLQNRFHEVVFPNFWFLDAGIRYY